jgi:hypothetical protein
MSTRLLAWSVVAKLSRFGGEIYSLLCFARNEHCEIDLKKWNLRLLKIEIIKVFFFLRGSVIPFLVGFCSRQVAILLRLLGITIIISHLITRTPEPIP